MMAVSLQSPKTLRQLLPDTVLPTALTTAEVTGITLSSRDVEPGFLFLAVPGTRQDGRHYIREAFARGALAVAAEAEGLQLARNKIIPIKGLAAEVSAIAARFYDNPSAHLTVTGITGTNGKTTCSQLLGQLYSLLGRDSGVIGTLGSGIYHRGEVNLQDPGLTTPDAVMVQALLAGFVAQRAEHVAMEVSSHSLDQGRVAAVRFTTAIFTNLSRDHLDYHSSMARYAEAKQRLFRQPGLTTAIVNADDPLAQAIVQNLDKSVVCYRYGLDSDADIQARDIELHSAGVRAQLFSPWGSGELVTGLLGRFNLANLLAVIAAACTQGLPFADVLAAIPQLRPVAGRMQRVEGGGPTVIVDYAHTPDALEKTLLALREHCSGELWCVFGCGGDRDTGKRRPMGEIAARLADHLVITSDNPRGESPGAIIEQICQGAPQAEVREDRAAAIKYAITAAQCGDTVLLAGKGHEDYQEINGVKQPFDDRQQAMAALQKRGDANG